MSDLVFHKTMRVAKKTVGLMVVMALIAACGGSGGDTSEDSATTTRETSAGGDEETLAEFFGWGGDPAAEEAQWRDQEAERQELIRVCMVELGFDYTPIQQPEGSFSVSFDEEEWARTQGFGVTTWFGNEDQFDQGMEWEDPNQEMTDAMSDSERDAFYEALYGSEEDWESEAITEIDPETGEEYQYFEGWGFGCEGEASEQVYGEMNPSNDLWEELNPQMESMWERVQADPRIVELNEEWSECMADAGYDYDSRDDMYQSVFEDLQQRFDEIVGDYWGTDPFEGWTEEEMNAFFEESTQDEIDAFFRDAESANRADVDEEAVAALQQEEIDLAVTNFECSGGINEAYEEVSREYEAEFIAANRSLLEQIREAQGG